MNRFTTYEKVAHCNPYGEIWLSEEFTSELIDNKRNSPEEMENLRTILSIAEKSLQEGKPNQGLRLYEKVLQQTAFRAKEQKELLPYAEQALRGLSKLTSSEEEYIWEASSQLYGDYRRILENR